MNTTRFIRRRGWLQRRRDPRKLGPAEDNGEVVEDRWWDDYPYPDPPEPPLAMPISYVQFELLSGAFGVRVPLGESGPRGGQEAPWVNSVSGQSRANKQLRLAQLDRYMNCNCVSIKLVGEMRCVASELWNAGIIPKDSDKSFSTEESQVLSLILSSHPLWLRSLDTWCRPEGSRLEALLNLAEHLLALYPVPEWLQFRNLMIPSTGNRHCYPPDPHRFDAPCEPLWAAYVASTQGFKLGPTLRLCASHFGIDLPVSAARFVFDVPAKALAMEGLQWLLIRVHGGSPELAGRLAGILPAVAAQWVPALIRVFVIAPNLLEQAQPIFDWILHKHTEAQRSYPPKPFQLTMRSPARILEAALEYRESQMSYERLCHSGRSWKSHGWNAKFDEGDQTWAITELLNSLALHEESKAMRHCVSSYSQDCEQGRSAIFSVTLAGRRMVTVEVNPKTLRVVQVHGFANRLPTTEETRVVNRWCTQFELGPRTKHIIQGPR